MTAQLDITEQELAIVQGILQSILPNNSRVWVFGSRAKHSTRHNSDLDLAIEASSHLNKTTLMQLASAFEESHLPYTVDLVDLQQVEAYFKDIIDEQKVSFPLWSKVPELRFPEFGEDWQEKALGDFMTFKNGINADKSQYGHGRKFINVLDIIADKPIYHDQIIGSVSVPDKEFEKNEVKYGDILFQRSSETREDAGQSNIYLDKEHTATFGGFVIRGRPTSDFSPMYFDLLLKTRAARKEITTKSGGSTRFNVGQDSLGSVKVVLTRDVIEQQKIASFLTSIDDKLTKLRRKRELLNDYKRGLMQQLFSQTIRFKQDDGSEFAEWENHLLGKVCDVRDGTHESPNYQESGYPLITSKNLMKNGTLSFDNVEYISEKDFIDVNRRSNVEVGDILFGMIGTLGNPVRVQSCDFAIKNVALIKEVSNLQNSFLIYFLNGNYIKKQFHEQNTGGTQKFIALGVIRNLKILLPNIEEQQKIADCLSSFDAKIDAVAQQIQQLETFKKGLLQKMFV